MAKDLIRTKHCFYKLKSQLQGISLRIQIQLLYAPPSTVAAPVSKNKVAQAEATGNDDRGIDSSGKVRQFEEDVLVYNEPGTFLWLATF
ncbi:vacuolar protein sorting-associated protein 2 homolog 1-like [Capsicum annuum]|uniref:vacuolar protein sorting-associated protein 2 homolog 1-like n=1 Tax=Capsicum annuum TaxID=4072 RepID=UPI001FB13362|nr:vacuolar protein sorting-associated protein 2 homolog 1-like [Capsicum annuum]